MRALLLTLAVVAADVALAAPYVEAGLGSAGFVRSDVLRAGRQQELGAGVSLRSDATVIRAGAVFAWSQHDGLSFWQQGDLLGEGLDEGDLAQGDTLLLSLRGRFDASFLTHPRLGVGLRAEAGVGAAPLLMERSAYLIQAVADEWSGSEPRLHQGLHPVVALGPQLTWTSPSGVGVGLHTGATFRSHVDLGYVLSLHLSWEPPGQVN